MRRINPSQSARMLITPLFLGFFLRKYWHHLIRLFVFYKKNLRDHRIFAIGDQ